MDLYTIWADKQGDITDLEWVTGMKSLFDHLVSEGKWLNTKHGLMVTNN